MQNTKVYCKAGNVELTENDAIAIYENGKYIVTSYGIFQPQWHDNQSLQRVSFHKISNIKGMARRGRYYALTGDEINHILGYELLRNL